MSSCEQSEQWTIATWNLVKIEANVYEKEGSISREDQAS